jgi:hypothetical protein
LLKTAKVQHANASDAKPLLQATKIATSVFTVTRLIARRVLDIANIMILKRWSNYCLSDLTGVFLNLRVTKKKIYDKKSFFL